MTTSTPDSHFPSLASLSLHHHHYPYHMESRNTREHHHQMEPPWSYSCGFTAAGFAWPPRSYTCSFCKREFRSAQALGGHMNVHRRDRARLRHCSPPPLTTPNPNPNSRSPIPNLNFSPPHCPHPVITHTFPSLLAPLAAPPQAAAKAGLLEVNLELAVGVRSSGGLEDGQLDLELRLGCF